MHHRANGDGDQIAAVVIRLDLDAWRQAAVIIDAIDSGSHTRHNIHGPLKLLHQHDAEQDVVLVVAAGDPQSRRVANLVVCDIGQDDRKPALVAHDDIADVADGSKRADAAHIDRLFANRDRAAADIGVAGRNCVDDLR